MKLVFKVCQSVEHKRIQWSIQSKVSSIQSNSFTKSCQLMKMIQTNQPFKSISPFVRSYLSNQNGFTNFYWPIKLFDWSKLTNQMTSQIFPISRTGGMTILSRFTFDGTKPTTIGVTYFKSCIRIMLSSLGNLLTTARIRLPGIRGSYSFGEYIDSNFCT